MTGRRSRESAPSAYRRGLSASVARVRTKVDIRLLLFGFQRRLSSIASSATRVPRRRASFFPPRSFSASTHRGVSTCARGARGALVAAVTTTALAAGVSHPSRSARLLVFFFRF